jgi:SAM-dependent methyltransferase
MSGPTHFDSLRYQRMNMRRLEHLAALMLPLEGRTVLELGAGVGDLTSFFLDRACTVTSVEPRPENVAPFRKRYTGEDAIWPASRLTILQGDIRNLADDPRIAVHQVVFCYGLLYHLDDPVKAIADMASRCAETLLLETSVSDRDDDWISFNKEDAQNVTNSVTGRGCLPTRRWVLNRLREHFAHVYWPTAQPEHDQFRLDRPDGPERKRRSRAVFVASRTPLAGPLLAHDLPAPNP